ncbi:MAG TPA: phosphate ABC transporter substrate-binding protein [Cellvibrionaceae bacterium]|nr:phosphate ABC transporter substrate-binding protein [Cellvibrionaceae bacterium]
MKSIVLLLSLIVSLDALADVAVIVHPSNKNTFALEDIESIFMVKKSTFSDGSKASPFYLSGEEATRTLFNEKALGKSSSQLKAYWSKLVFTGKGTPPPELPSSTEAVAKVAADPTAVAYVDIKAVTSAVKVVLSLP